MNQNETELKDTAEAGQLERRVRPSPGLVIKEKTVSWNETGHPVCLEAAAIDAMEWLEVFYYLWDRLPKKLLNQKIVDDNKQRLLQSISALQRYLAESVVDLRCPKCGGEADNGFDREFPPNPYLCKRCAA
jgi:hypothetical protein